jgi:hypothetical protein
VQSCLLPALSGLGALQQLELRGCRSVNWAALKGLKLQHLQLVEDYTPELNTAQLLSVLQQQTELTSLQVQLPYRSGAANVPAAAYAYAALTASSKLQHLDLCSSKITAEEWQHVFRTPGQLLHLTSLAGCRIAAETPAARASILQACPGLQRLELWSLSDYDRKRLRVLQVREALYIHLVHMPHVTI